ncbi:MAG: ABC transporter permease [Candidatus Riflebacteria bacterium]|nr:ABC transporter permease [Candidatus Riflebacteria bacterium]
MVLFITRRLLVTIPLMLGILFVTFFLMQMVPGNPVDRMLGERGGTPEERARLIRELGLDRPWYVRFGDYVLDLARGDPGRTLLSREKIADEIADRFPNTCILAITSLALATVLGLAAGILSAVYPGRLIDHGCRLISIFGLSTPVFWFGLMLMLFFALHLRWLPSSSDTPWLALNLVLPSITLGLRPAAFIQRVTRSELMDILRSDYIRTARAKGLPERVVILRHALRNAMVPIVTLIGLDLGSLLSVSVITERIFNFRGIGLYALEGIQNRDYAVVMATVLLTSFLFLIANLVVDVLYALLDPRIRYD